MILILAIKTVEMQLGIKVEIGLDSDVMNAMKTCNSVTFYFMKNSFSDLLCRLSPDPHKSTTTPLRKTPLKIEHITLIITAPQQ